MWLYQFIFVCFQATEVKSMTDHNHEADRFAIAAMKVKSEIKATVEANRGKPGQIIADKLATVPKEVINQKSIIN